MKFIAATIALSFLGTAAVADNFKRITTEAEYIKTAVGKKTCNDTGCVTARKNGKMKGQFGSQRFSGTWKWQGTYLCRSGKLGSNDLGTDCMVVEAAGKEMRLTRDKGKGKTVTYTIK